jgi:hypothetical protein
MSLSIRKTIRTLWNRGNVLAKKLFKGEGSITDIVDLHSVMLKLQQCKGPNNEVFFNLLLKKIQPKVEAYNELLQMSQMSQIRFDFKLFAGPEAVLAAKAAEAAKEAKASADYVAKQEELHALQNHQREYGFMGSDLTMIPKDINTSMLLFLTTDGPAAKNPSLIETCLGIQCENEHRYHEIIDCIRTSVNTVDDFMSCFKLCTQNVHHCMIFTKCGNCTVFAACIYLIRPAQLQDYLKESIVCYVMRNVHSQFRSLLMVIYLRSLLKDSFPILARFLDAIENPLSSYRNELVTSLRTYPNCRSSSEEIDPSQYQAWVKFWTERSHLLIKSP